MSDQEILLKEHKKTMRKACSAAVKRLGPNTAQLIEDYRKNGVCSVCGLKNSKKRQLCRDHNHESGIFRGLLCTSCNLALGLIKDDLDTIKAMADYLQKFPVLRDEDMIDFENQS